MMRKALILLCGIPAAMALFIIITKMQIEPVTDDVLRAKYATGTSKFMTVDGVPLHIRDEGQGPAVVLLHGSYGSLRMWDDWANLLREDRRVIRFDIPPIGLSGPDPTGRYGYQRAQELLDAVVNQLAITQFDLAGTSVGGAVAFRYAASNPDRVRKLIIAGAPMVPLSEAAKAGRGLPAALSAVNWYSATFLNGHKSQLHQTLFLKHLFFDDTKVTPKLAQEYADIANRANNSARGYEFARKSQTTTETANILAAVTVPTLVMWCDSSPVLPVSHGQDGAALMTGAHPDFVVVPDCGHIIPLEKGVETAIIAQQFFDGDLQPNRQADAASQQGYKP